MKNLYALDNKHNLIHIENVIKGKKEKFYCCNCENELIPKKGKIIAHHFSHKNQINCSYESYIHKLGKLKFYNKYLKCLDQGLPFFIDYKSETTCTSCKSIERIETECRLNDNVQKFDLTKWFDVISMEKGINGFIADILLSSSSFKDNLLIEIAVTHKCETSKINSGLRIIEIELNNENDLNSIDDRYFALTDKNITFYNFKIDQNFAPIRNPKSCHEKLGVFLISKNNKATYAKIPITEILDNITNEKFKYFRILNDKESSFSGNRFIELVIEYAFKDRNFKNCFSCRFSAQNNSYYANYNIFCRRLRKEIPSSNFGSTCDKYWLLENPKLNN